ncbi:hypothetical protein [Pyxidicoccus caerfyrddinensis]|uniref:hypothetical protein n=1 Tax=Pyxidicoccus caerfyrddinensis TaxID=2709663 RepID=UPI0013DC5C31|nr:hypothetical protein [Pyxidicoccus caerfyrddinensis]
MLRDASSLLDVLASLLHLALAASLWAERRRLRREYPPRKSNPRRTPTLRVVSGGRRG